MAYEMTSFSQMRFEGEKWEFNRTFWFAVFQWTAILGLCYWIADRYDRKRAQADAEAKKAE